MIMDAIGCFEVNSYSTSKSRKELKEANFKDCYGKFEVPKQIVNSILAICIDKVSGRFGWFEAPIDQSIKKPLAIHIDSILSTNGRLGSLKLQNGM